MNERQDPEVRELRKIERDVREIKDRTRPMRSFLSGLLSGAGWIVGSILALAFLGWILSLIGFIPGFGDIASYLHNIVQTWHGGH